MSATLEKREGLTATSVGREAWTSGGGSPHNHPGWDGQEPRVIYHDVLARVDMIKRRRVAASSVDDRSNGRREDSRYDCDEDEGEKRVVDVIFDPPGEISLGKMDPLGPELVIVDNRGQERSAEFVGDVMEPVAVGTILVAKAWGTREGLAAYAVGEEEYQIFIVGNGVACSPTLLTQENYAELGGIWGEERRSFIRDRVPFSLSLESEHPPSRPTNNNELLYEDGRGDDSDYYDARGPHNRRGLESFDDSRDTGGRKGGDEGDGEGTWLGAADAEREGEKKVDAARRRAVNLRLEGLAVLTRGESTGGSGSMSKRSPHQLFRQAADLGDPRSFFYLALLQAASLAGGEVGAGQAQARTWAMCGTDAFDRDSSLLLAFRFHAGHKEEKLCREGVRFYQQAVDDLRQDHADVQGAWNPPDMFRLGGENGLGGWGVDRGGGGGNERRVPWSAGAARGTGVGRVGEMEARPQDMDPRDDLFLRAETGDPSALMALGYLYMTGSEDFFIEQDYARAEQLMWQAVRGGEFRAYGYLGWMHHHGVIGDHLPPHLQETNTLATRKRNTADGNPSIPQTEEDIQKYAVDRWGTWVLDETRGKVKIDADDTDGKDVGGDAGEGRRGVDDGTEHPPGTDVFGGPGAPDASYDWALLGGGVSGALKAAELYSDGYFEGDPECARFVGDMYLHGEYSDTEDGTGALGRWSMLQAEFWYTRALKLGNRYDEPQPVAAFRLGTMMHHGFIPYVGVNMTEARRLYEKSAKDGGMDAVLALADLHYYGYDRVFQRSCAEGSQLYKKYADLCIKDDMLASARASFEQGRYHEAFLLYLIAAEQGSTEGQASLSWLLKQGVMVASATTGRGSGGGGIFSRIFNFNLKVDSKAKWGLESDENAEDASSGTGDRGGGGGGSYWGSWEGGAAGVGSWGYKLRGVVDTVREMGGDPQEMAEAYRLLAAEQGDVDARCEIADELYELAKARGAVPFGTGWLPWVWQESNDNDEDEDEDTTKTSPSDASTRASEGVGEGSESEGAAPVETPRQGFKGAIEARNLYVSRLSGEGADDDEGESKREMENEDRRQMEVEREKKKKDKESEREELRRRRERGKEGQRLLAEAVKYYMMAADESSERAPSKRGLFSMGWLHQHGVGVELNPSLARYYYSRSSSAPGYLGLLMMGVSAFVLEAAEPLVFSTLAAVVGVWWMKRRRQRQGGGGGVGRGAVGGG